MARPRLSEETIISAAEGFVTEQGKTPTYEELQALLGVKSPTTLNKYYRPWRARRDAELQDQPAQAPAQVELLPVPDNLSAAVAGAWSVAVAEIKAEGQREILEAQLHLKARLEQLAADLAERDATITAIEEQGEANQEAFETEATGLRERIEVQIAEIDSLKTSLAKSAEELAVERAKTSMLAIDLTDARSENAAEREKTNAATSRAAALSADVMRISGDLDKSQGEAIAEREKLGVATARAAGLAADVQRLTADLAGERHIADKEREKGDVAAVLAARLAADAERLKADLADAKHETAAIRESASAAVAQVAGLTADVQRLTEDLKAERQRTDIAMAKAAEAAAALERSIQKVGGPSDIDG